MRHLYKNKEGLYVLGKVLVGLSIIAIWLFVSKVDWWSTERFLNSLLFCGFLLIISVCVFMAGRSSFKIEKAMDEFEKSNYPFSKLYFGISDFAIQHNVVKKIDEEKAVKGLDEIGDFVYIKNNVISESSRIILDSKIAAENTGDSFEKDLVVEFNFEEIGNYIMRYNNFERRFYIYKI